MISKKDKKDNMTKEPDKDFLEFLIKSLVDHPDDVKVDRRVDEMGVLLTLTVNPEDMGQIIGKAGSTARAIRNLVRIVGLKNHARVNLKIEEPAGGRAPRRMAEEKRGDLEDLNL
ncbi:MAG: KH domain-containing protein [Candidatus Pacebacteria bacterium]|nr:KH domain-containing protein [Candidatus Paceibacterota bacterium]